MATSKKLKEESIPHKDCSQSLPVKNGFANGHISGSNGYINGFCKNSVGNSNGFAHNGVATNLQNQSNGLQCQINHGDSIKKIN